jgi:diguanylate cyclase (GGDEF)-like protein/PAS domain S-box-containing protein
VRQEGETDSAWLAAVLDSSQDAIMAWSLSWELTGWNCGAERTLGYSREQALGMSVKALWTPSVCGILERMVTGLVQNQEIARFDAEYLHRDGTTVEVSVTITAIRAADQRVTGVASIVRDISQRRQADRQLAEERTRWATAFHSAPIGMALLALDGTWIEVNGALCRLLARDREDLLTTDLGALFDPDDREADERERARVGSGEIEGYEAERRFCRPDGSVMWARLSLALVRDLDDEPLYFVLQVQDVTARKDSEAELSRYAAQLAQLARVDPVTGLPNYRQFAELLAHELERARRYGREWSIVLFDIDGFRQLNDAGRLRADRALALVGHTISDACRASDHAARIGADEFALILPNTDNAQARATGQRVRNAVQQAGVASVSHGTVTWPTDGDSIELLLLRADMNLQEAKRAIATTAHASASPAPVAACPTNAVQELVAVAQRFLGMELAFLARITDGTQTLEAVSGEASSFGIDEGDVLELEQTLCKRMLDGRIPNAVPAVADERELSSLAITDTAHIGAYVGVPVGLANGHTYGTLCGISHHPVDGLADVNLDVMRSFAHLIANHIEHDVLGASVLRSETESTGINALLSALTARDHYTGEHSESVVALASTVAQRLGLSPEQVREVEQVARLHDIGKVGIPDSILQKRGPLSDEEWQVMRQHPTIGARILAGVPAFAHLTTAVSAEHERFDGTGYPDGLRGSAIPLASRITLACDAYHAMTSDRPYRGALSPVAARCELQRGAGTQFDPMVINALLAVFDGQRTTEPAAARGGEISEDVLTSRLPRQTPRWTRTVEPQAGQPLGHARAQCQRCGSHTPITVARATVGGNCINCGSYELRPIIDDHGTT